MNSLHKWLPETHLLLGMRAWYYVFSAACQGGVCSKTSLATPGVASLPKLLAVQLHVLSSVVQWLVFVELDRAGIETGDLAPVLGLTVV